MKSLTPEERAVGKENFHAAIGSDLTRREFLAGAIAAAAVPGASLGAYYYGYSKVADPVRVGVIGTGDEGSVLIGAHTPEYLNIVAIADIRPYNIHRAFHGDRSSDSVWQVRPGLMHKYGWQSEDQAREKVKVYANDYHDLLNDSSVEAVIIALPLWLHDLVAFEAMAAGKHVLTEKLMAHSVHQCKEMGRVSQKLRLHLATGHQRHYSVLYDNAVQIIKSGLLGELHHVRAQWHRGNLPGKDSWSPALPDQLVTDLAKIEKELETAEGARVDALLKRKSVLVEQVKDKDVDAAAYGYQSKSLPGGYVCSPLEELIRWRLWDRTGGGLMAELGSHQLDASGIFCTAVRTDGEKARPLSVVGVGGRHLFPEDRDVDDHVYCTYEYPAPAYNAEDPQAKQKKIVVTYSSINGNDFGGYGEVVMGTTGTLILEKEQEYMLYKGSDTASHVQVKRDKDGPALDTTASGGSPAAAVGQKALASGPISRGYTEEMEHWAWCIRNFDWENNQPKCKPVVALADAVIALTSNIAIRENRRIEFDPLWFDIDRDETPEGVRPRTADEVLDSLKTRAVV